MALQTAGVAIPLLDIEGEAVANRVLEAVGLAALPPNDSTPRVGNAYMSSDVVPQSGEGDVSSQLIQQGQHQPEISFPASTPALGNIAPTPGSTLEDSLAFADWAGMGWDETISPDWPWSALLAPDLEVSLQHTGLQLRPPDQNAPAAATTSGPHEEEDEENQDIINQIAARFGSLQLAPDGKLRYFGTPANFHLFGNNGRSTGGSASMQPRSTRFEGQRLLRSLELDLDVDLALEDHLIQMYFAWHNSCHPVVDNGAFWLARRQQTGVAEEAGLYSDVLVNAMCAIGASHEARYHPDLVTFPRTLAEFFAERAKALLEIELDSPCVSTVQALLLLSSHEAGHQRIARSWLYGGMAMRLCFDIGLQLNTNAYVEQGIMSAAESQARQTTFWASYVMNYRLSFSLGRPFALDGSEITVGKPLADEACRNDVWRPYPQPYTACMQAEGGVVLGTLISAQRISLCETVEPIARALYGNTNISLKSLQELSERSTSAMIKWKESLPSTLRIPTDPYHEVVPQLLVLHLEYYYLQILVHRPWTSRRHQPIPAQGRGYRHARMMCIDSACEMAGVLSLFEKRFGYNRLDVETAQILPSAALILTFATVSHAHSQPQGRSEKEASLALHLNTLFRALDELGRTHLSAREHLDSLLLIQQKWKAIHGQHQGLKRIDVGAGGNEAARQAKRGRLC